jgi:predicted permease
MDTWLMDLRYALRGLYTSKGFTAVAVLTLGLGIGVNTAIFSVINAFLLRPLPVPDPEELVVVASQTELVEFPIGVSYPDFLDYRGRTDVLQDIALYQPNAVSLRDRGEAQRAWALMVTGNYFDMLGVEALHGRTFTAEEGEVRGGAAVVVLDHGFWEREYGADPAVIGRGIEINGARYTVIGVTPPEFPGTEFLIGVDAYVSVMMVDEMRGGLAGMLDQRGARIMRAMARLQPGVTASQASAALNALADGLAREYPETNRAVEVVVVPETSARPEISVSGQLPAVAWTFMALVTLVLLIACANIANLLIARASTRHREIAIRTALGAGRWRILRQLMSESAVLGLLGGGVGLLLGIWASGYLASIVMDFPSDIPIRVDVGPDYRVFGFALLGSLLTGVLAGGIPAWRAGHGRVSTALQDGGRGTGTAGATQWLRGALVVAQVAGSLVLLVAAGLFLRSLQHARDIDFGFRVEQTLMASIDPALAGYDEIRGAQLYRDIVERVRTLPAVNAASFTGFVPFGGRAGVRNVRVPGRDATADSETLAAFYNVVGPDYFRAAGTRVLRGRAIEARDTTETTSVALVNETLAANLWPGEDPLGKRIGFRGPEGPWFEVVGVAEDSKVLLVWEEDRPFVYLALEQVYVTPATLYVHTAGEPDALAAAVRAELAELAPDLPIYDVNTMRTHIESGTALGIVRIGALMVGSFGLVGLMLAAIGLYGVMAFTVSQRSHEIGVRLALGADAGRVLRMVVRQGVVLAGIGMALGLILALAVARGVAGFLLETSATDPLTWAGVIAFLGAVTVLASYVPARRATRVDPLTTLRGV